MTREELETALRLERIYMPYAARRRAQLFQNNERFVHYTSAPAALSIVESKRMWMRNTTCMTDYSEVMHGLTLLSHAQCQEARDPEPATRLAGHRF
jgi:hypothetical protein